MDLIRQNTEEFVKEIVSWLGLKTKLKEKEETH